MKWYLLILLQLTGSVSLFSQTAAIATDLYVNSEKEIKIFVREIRPASSKDSKLNTILLVHGGFGGLAAFDLPVQNGSLARSLSEQGFRVYIMDIRGWEHSSIPDSSDITSALASYKEAATDIDAVVDHILAKDKIKKIGILGWASGGHWAGYYTTLHNEKVDRLIVLNSLYGVKAPWSISRSFADPADSTRFNEKGIGRWRRSSRRSLLAPLVNGIPAGRLAEWRDPAITEACVNAVTAFSKDSTFTAPGDFRKESFNLAAGYQYWNARDIKVPVLILRGELDFWSREIDVTAFCEALKNAPFKKCVTIPDGTHFVFLDRAEKGRGFLLNEVIGFWRN